MVTNGMDGSKGILYHSWVILFYFFFFQFLSGLGAFMEIPLDW